MDRKGTDSVDDRWDFMLAHAATKNDVAALRRDLERLPTTWTFLIAILVAQIGTAAIVAATLLAAARMFVHT